VLPTCPACKQSVLDDDATECPFCGANMKTGKGTKSKPAAPVKAAPKTPGPKTEAPAETKPAANKPKPSSARKASSFDDDDDDPFSTPEDDPFTAAAKEDAASKENAIPVFPRKGKLNNTEIKCPMCESVGFVPETAFGKDVKCYNPKCTMPVFLAPKRFAAPLPPVVPTKVKAKKASNSKMPLIMSLVGGVALVAVVGALSYFWDDLFAPKEPAKQPWQLAAGEGGAPVVKPDGGGIPIPPDGVPPVDGPPKVDVVVVPKGPDIVELLNLMHLLSSEGDIDQNKLKCRRLVAIAQAVTTNPAGMEEQFQKLDSLDAKRKDLRVPALLVAAWNQFNAGDKAGALKTVEQTIPLVDKKSRETQEAVLEMASLLVGLGKLKEAEQLLASMLPGDQNTELAVAVILARVRKDFDLTVELPGATPLPSRPWPQVGVTLILATHGLWKEALQWAEASPDVDTKTICLLAWADAKTRSTLAAKTAADPAAEGVASSLTPGGKVELLGRLALTNAAAGNKVEAQRLITAGLEALKAIKIPAAARTDGFKEVVDWKTPDLLPVRQAILGAALVGQAQGVIGQADQGWATTLEAMKLARSLAPSPAGVAAVQQIVADLKGNALRDKVRATFKLRGNEEALQKVSDLRENLRKLGTESAARLKLQETVLIGAVHAGMASHTWKEVLSLSERTDPAELEPFLVGVLQTHLQDQLNLNGNKAELAELEAKVADNPAPADEILDLKKMVKDSLTPDKFHQIIDYTNQQEKLSARAEMVILQSFIEAAKLSELGVETLGFVADLNLRANSQVNMIKLEGLRMTSAYASRHGKANDLKKLVRDRISLPLEKIAGFLGLIEGETIWRQEHPAPSPVAAPNPASPVAKNE
jgi:hypothetical protein